MKYLIAFFLSLNLFASGYHEPNDWSTRDTLLEVASETGIAAEWAQMSDCIKPGYGYGINGIDAKILGSNRPSQGKLNSYFIFWEVAHPLISVALPRPYRGIWQGSTIAFELVVTHKNAGVGCRIKF